MTSVFYPQYAKGVRIRVVGRSKYAGQFGVISMDATGNTQAYFNVKLDSGKTMQLHAQSLSIFENKNTQP